MKKNCGNCGYFDAENEHRVDNDRTMSRCLKNYTGGMTSDRYCADWKPSKRKRWQEILKQALERSEGE